MTNLDEAWDEFLISSNMDSIKEVNCMNDIEKNNNIDYLSSEIPKASDIYISTKTIISYINTSINLYELFWQLPVQDYHILNEGIIKKQIKINSLSPTDLDKLNENLKKENFIDQQIINHIENPSGRIKYKDIRKISIGICKKDILSYRCKKKGAFYNCFVLILRVLDEKIYKEIHIKIFNTGKLEIPGIQKDSLLVSALNLLIKILKPILKKDDLTYETNIGTTVLINSNFNCGFYIDREKLFNILRFEYNINSCYDPCSYPGIQCEFYYNTLDKYNNGKQSVEKNNHTIKISFMIFRTGSVLIVGKCDEVILKYIYNFIKDLLQKEFTRIATKIISEKLPTRIKKIKKKYIYFTDNNSIILNKNKS